MTRRYYVVVCLLLLASCDDLKALLPSDPEPPHPEMQLIPLEPQPPESPSPKQHASSVPAAGAPVGPVPPGRYVNHVGNPDAGYWLEDRWYWHSSGSSEEKSTLRFLVAAGLGGAAGAPASYLFEKKYFEENNPKGWKLRRNRRKVSKYLNRHGRRISRREYRRQYAGSERERRAHINRQRKAFNEPLLPLPPSKPRKPRP